MNKPRLVELAQETVSILERGSYLNGNCELVSLQPALDAARSGTVLHEIDAKIPSRQSGSPTITVANETTLVASRRLQAEYGKILALNFASAKNPGGGFLRGTMAQEESLAYTSGLYACLKGSSFYAAHREQADPIYSHRIIYSPEVPVFRDDYHTLLDEPWTFSVLTCAAPNLGAMLDNGHSERLDEVNRVMYDRIDRILDVAYMHNHRNLVLGAFGCGIFRNDPVTVARMFKELVSGSDFDNVHFAVLDHPDGMCIQAFQTVLGS